MALVVNSLSASESDIREAGFIPGLGRYPGGGHDNLFRYHCLENPMAREDWQATVNRVAKSWT